MKGFYYYTLLEGALNTITDHGTDLNAKVWKLIVIAGDLNHITIKEQIEILKAWNVADLAISLDHEFEDELDEEDQRDKEHLEMFHHAVGNIVEIDELLGLVDMVNSINKIENPDYVFRSPLLSDVRTFVDTFNEEPED